MLTRYFVQKHARRMERNIESIPTYALEALTNYDWPGNIRELQNVIERSVVLSDGPELHVALPELDGISAPVRGARPGFECDRHIRAGAHSAGAEGNEGNGRGIERGGRPPRAEADDPAITHAEIQYRAVVSVSNRHTTEVIHGTLPHRCKYEFSTCGPNCYTDTSSPGDGTPSVSASVPPPVPANPHRSMDRISSVHCAQQMIRCERVKC